jgi:plastocyanin
MVRGWMPTLGGDVQAGLRDTMRWAWFAMLVLLVPSIVLPDSLHARQADGGPEALPPIQVDALGDARWSDHAIFASPGQVIIVTNRDVERHTFVVDAWQLDINLPTLEPIEVLVPEDAAIDTDVEFYSGVGDDRDEGMVGVIHVISSEEQLAGQGREVGVATSIQDRTIIEIGDDFTFSPSVLDAQAGSFLEIRNDGVIEHHFVIDEWNVNETIPAGDVAIVQVPETIAPGTTFTFYCSVPGHRSMGMEGQLTVVNARLSVGTVSPDGAGRVAVGKDLRPFVPDAGFLGSEWSRLRIGDASTLLEDEATMSSDVFPSEGLGAVYVGPEGSRVTLIVLPLTDRSVPANQVRDAVSLVQSAMIGSWNKDRIGSAAYTDAAPPAGCDVALRAGGIVPVLTIPGGSTACQLRSAGVAIFVSVEGSVGDLSGVAASDEVISLLLTRPPRS